MITIFKYFYRAIKNNLTRALLPVDYIFTTIIFAGIVTSLTTEPAITYQEGGFRVLLITLSWFIALLMINNFVWVGVTFLMHTVRRNKIKKNRHLSLTLFILSHLIASFVLMSNFFHYVLFREHWNPDTISNAYYGIISGNAPMEISLVQVALLFIAVVSLLSFIMILVKLCLPVTSRMQKINYVNSSISFVSCLIFLSVIQHTIVPNWYSEQLQDSIPWFQFIKQRTVIPINDESLKNVVDIRNVRAEKVSQLITKLKILPKDIKAQNKPNILIVHVEALRSDMLNKENMPNLYKFGTTTAEILHHHFSSSNNTVGSMFGLISGLSGQYYPHFRDTPFMPPAIEIFKNLGYQFAIFNSVSNEYQNAESLLFSNFKKYGNIIDGTHDDRDAKIVEEYGSIISKTQENESPRFDYFVINSTHFSYYYPESYEIYTPVLKDINMESLYVERKKLESNKQLLKNRYLNSVLYADTLISTLLKEIKSNHLLENTVIIIVGDHGEEFWEHNRFGHNFSFVNEQVQTAAVVKFPGGLNTQYRYTSHSDLLPTVLESMGLDYDVTPLFTGKDLSQYQAEKDFITVSMGVVNKQKHKDELVVGDGIKVHYTINNGIGIEYIATDDEKELDFYKNEQVIYKLIKKSLGNTAAYH